MRIEYRGHGSSRPYNDVRQTHDAPEFRIRCLPRDKQTSTVFLDALGKDSSALTGDRFRLQWVSLYASEIAAVPFASGLEVGQCFFRNPFCKHVYTPVITLTRYAGLFHMALAVFLPLMDGNGFSTDLEGLCDLRWPFPTPQRPVQGLFPRSLPGCRSAAPHG